MEDCAITSQSRGQIDFVLQTNMIRRLCGRVDGKGEVGMYSLGDFRLEDQRDVRVGRVDVVGIFMDGFMDGIRTRLVDD